MPRTPLYPPLPFFKLAAAHIKLKLKHINLPTPTSPFPRRRRQTSRENSTDDSRCAVAGARSRLGSYLNLLQSNLLNATHHHPPRPHYTIYLGPEKHVGHECVPVALSPLMWSPQSYAYDTLPSRISAASPCFRSSLPREYRTRCCGQGLATRTRCKRTEACLFQSISAITILISSTFTTPQTHTHAMRPLSLLAFLLPALLAVTNGVPSSFQSGLLPVTRNSSLFYWYCPPSGPASRPPLSTNSTPLILWLQGGPGASGLIGLLYEMGPYRLEKVMRDRENADEGMGAFLAGAGEGMEEWEKVIMKFSRRVYHIGQCFFFLLPCRPHCRCLERKLWSV